MRGLQRLGGFGGVADPLNHYNHYVGTPDYLAQDITRHRDVTPDVGAAVCAAVSAEERASRGPRRAGQAGSWSRSAEAARRKARSARRDRAGQRRRAVASDAARSPRRIARGAASGAAVVSAGERPDRDRAAADRRRRVVSASLVVRTGSDANPADKPGLAELHGGDARSGDGDAHRAAAGGRSRADRRDAVRRRRRWMRRPCRPPASREIFPRR